jgi:hypothetical protein
MSKDDMGDITAVSYWFRGAAAHEFQTYNDGFDAWLKMHYNASNLRVQKVFTYDEDSGGGGGEFLLMEGGSIDTLSVTNYVRDRAGNVLAVYNGTTLIERYVWGPTGLISIVKGTNSSPTRYFTGSSGFSMGSCPGLRSGT